MLAFDPSDRISVLDALEHPWLSAYHDVADEPECPAKFEKWRDIEKLETLDEFREALWEEISDYRRQVRGVNLDLSGLPLRTPQITFGASAQSKAEHEAKFPNVFEPEPTIAEESESISEEDFKEIVEDKRANEAGRQVSSSPDQIRQQITSPIDPVVTYARRSSILQPSRQGSTYNSPLPSSQHLPHHNVESPKNADPNLGPGTVVFPSQGFVVPARSRTGSTAGGEMTRRLLRTLSTVSIHESAEGLAGGLAGIAPIGKFIVDRQTEEADAPPSEMPHDFGIDETSEGEEDKDLFKTYKKQGRRFQLE